MNPMVIDIWYANPSLSRDEACKVIGVSPSEAQSMVDVTHAAVPRLPTDLRLRIAGYTTGTPDIQWTGADWTRFKNARLVRIDQSNATGIHGDGKDVEPGASSAATAVEAARVRAERGVQSFIYCDGSDLGEVHREAEAKRMSTQIVAVQYAWPSSNPSTIIPGTRLTLREVNADLSVVRPDWFPLVAQKRRKPIPVPKPPAHVTIPVSFGGLATAIVTYLNAHGAHLTTAEVGAIVAGTPSLVGLVKTLTERKP